jgi:hypothetical protein
VYEFTQRGITSDEERSGGADEVFPHNSTNMRCAAVDGEAGGLGPGLSVEDGRDAVPFIESEQWQLSATIGGDTPGHFLTLLDQCRR